MQDGFNLEYYWKMLKRRYPYMVGAFVVVFAVAAFITVWLPPVYRSEARILVESQQIPSDLVRSTVTALADERIQVIKQRITTRDTIVDLTRKFGLFAESRKEMSITQLVGAVRERIDISLYDIGNRRRGGNAFTIAFIVAFEYEKPDVAASVANELVTLILNEDVKTRTSRASETTNFLERETERLQRQLLTVEQQIAQFKAENAGSLPSQQIFHLAALERAEQQQLTIARDINAANDQIRFQEFELSIRSQNPAYQSGQAGAAITPQAPLEQRLQLLKAQLAEKLVVYSERHPDVKTLKGQIAAVEKQIAETPAPDTNADSDTISSPEQLAQLDIQARIVAEKINAIKSRKELLIKQQDALNKQIADLQTLLNRIPEVQNGLAVLERNQEATQKALTEITDKLADARLGERLESDQQAERLQVIEQPVAPQNPVKPDRKRMLALGFALALAAAGGAVFGLEALDSSVKGSSDLLSKVNKRPLVVIPYIMTRREKRLRFIRIIGFAVLMVVLMIAVLAALHFLFMPLDILIPKVINRLQI